MTLGTVASYPEKIQKIYKSYDTTTHHFCWHQHFFIENQQILLYQEIQVQIALEHIISNAFNFFEPLKIFFNKCIWNFDNVSKIG